MWRLDRCYACKFNNRCFLSFCLNIDLYIPILLYYYLFSELDTIVETEVSEGVGVVVVCECLSIILAICRTTKGLIIYSPSPNFA